MSARARIIGRLVVILTAIAVGLLEGRFSVLWVMAFAVNVVASGELGWIMAKGEMPDPWVSRYGRAIWVRLPRLGPWMLTLWIRPFPDPRSHFLLGLSCFLDEDGELNAIAGVGVLTVRLVSTRVRTSRRERRKIAAYLAEREGAA